MYTSNCEAMEPLAVPEVEDSETGIGCEEFEMGGTNATIVV
jgi:hypothetical protein